MDFSKLSLAELSQGIENAPKLTKTGGKDDVEKQDGPFVDPYTLGVQFLTEIAESTGKVSRKGTGQLELKIGQLRDDGTVKSGGRVWLDLPVVGATAEMTAEEEATYIAKAGARFLRFLRAVSPGTFNVYASIDKSNPKKWVYVGFDGQPMNAKAREAKGEQINKAVIGLAERIMAGDKSTSFAGTRVMLQKAASNNPKYPFLNFSVVEG